MTSRSRRPTAAEEDPNVFAPVFYVLCGTTVLCVAMLAVRSFHMGSDRFHFLLWNLFLAWLPLIVAMLAAGAAKWMRGAALALVMLVLGAGWLLLYPNAPYLTTDLIHLIGDTSYNWNLQQESVLVWYDLVVFFLFSWCGLLLGYLSMLHFHMLVRRFAGRFAGWLFVVVVSFLGGFGVYLGRMIRLNSWDVVFSPFRLIEGVRAGLDHRGAKFTLLFGLLILIVYLSLTSLRGLRGARSDAANSKAV
jgi:uncharacterized membrane protein